MQAIVNLFRKMFGKAEPVDKPKQETKPSVGAFIKALMDQAKAHPVTFKRVGEPTKGAFGKCRNNGGWIHDRSKEKQMVGGQAGKEVGEM